MKRYLLPLLASLALPTAVSAEISDKIHNRCKDVSDYMGCVKSNKNKEKTNYFKRFFGSNELKNKNKNNAEKCLLGLYNCKNIDHDYISSKLSRKVKDQIYKKEQEKARVNKIRKRVRDEWKKQPNMNFLEQYTHQGKTYTASKNCPKGKRFVWNTKKGFLKKDTVTEIGCLTPYELQSLKNQSRKKSGGGSGYDATLRMDMETKRIWNNINQDYKNRYDRWNEREFGY